MIQGKNIILIKKPCVLIHKALKRVLFNDYFESSLLVRALFSAPSICSFN